jgi:hypothetical protein
MHHSLHELLNDEFDSSLFVFYLNSNVGNVCKFTVESITGLDVRFKTNKNNLTDGMHFVLYDAHSTKHYLELRHKLFDMKTPLITNRCYSKLKIPKAVVGLYYEHKLVYFKIALGDINFLK